MKIYAISDLHLPGGAAKPMEVFGSHWKGHYDIIKNYWRQHIQPEDYILHYGDFCWALKLDAALPELADFAALPGHKVMIKGNHDYWWTSLSKMRAAADSSISFLQNDSIIIEDHAKQTSILLCGSRGRTTPGCSDFTPEDEKIYAREVIRLELSLKNAEKQKQKCTYPHILTIALMHYPPMALYGPFVGKSTQFLDLLLQYKVNKVVFGHLHKPQPITQTYFTVDQTEFYLTSCDMLHNIPAIIYE